MALSRARWVVPRPIEAPVCGVVCATASRGSERIPAPRATLGLDDLRDRRRRRARYLPVVLSGSKAGRSEQELQAWIIREAQARIIARPTESCARWALAGSPAG